MNQKKAKRLRKESRNLPVSSDTFYKPYSEPRWNYGRLYVGIPRVMGVCKRSVYQGMK